MDGKTFLDVGPEFLNLYDERISEAERDLGELGISQLDEMDLDDLNYGQARRKVLSIVINYLYSGRTREAREAFNQYWHAEPAVRERMRKRIIDNYCGALRERTGISGGNSCDTGGF